jgi:hypothetical protein
MRTGRAIVAGGDTELVELIDVVTVELLVEVVEAEV